MPAPSVIQTSFNSGEWSPSLNARVDLKQYHSGAALLRNFFVDYRGGATASPGTKYILQTYAGGVGAPVRLIPFQASQTVSYILEFGNAYIRFFNNGAPVLEGSIAITGATRANPCVVSVANTYTISDWVYIQGVAGMTQLNGNYYRISARSAGTITLADLNGVAIDSTAYGAYTSGGSTSRVYTLASPYASSEVGQIKFAQNVSKMVLSHPNHPTYELILTSAANWTIQAVTFGSTIAAPVGQAVATTLGAGTFNYAYVITAVDVNGQESGPSAFATLAAILDQRTVAGTNTVTWTAVTGAASYNVYKAEIRQTNAVPAGAQFGFIGNCTATTFIDSNIGQDFSLCPPVVSNPFNGTGLQSITITNAGSYTPPTTAGFTAAPTVSFTGGGGGSGAAATVYMQAISFSIVSGGGGYIVGGIYYAGIQGVLIQCTSITPGGVFASGIIVNAGSITGSLGNNNVSLTGGGVSVQAALTITYAVQSVGITSPGTGYSPAPTVVFSSGAAAATAVLGAPSSGNPTVPAFFDQRLVLAGPVSNPQQLNFSQPGSYYNYNVTNPVQPDNAFTGNLVSGQLNTIQSLISQPQGLIVLTDRQAWLVNGGSPGAGIDATQVAANAHVFSGATGVPPIVAVDNILYVQAKGSIVRDLVFDFNKQVYTGADISVLSSHLFYGYSILEWAWAEEPFKVVWAVRNDGTLLSLTFLKEQELIAWAHRDTNGAFKSIATVTEQTSLGFVDAVYVIVQRSVAGSTVWYIERMVEQYYPNGVTDAWQVDAGLQYNGTSTLTFTGAQHLQGLAVVGLATDNTGVVTTFTATVSASGAFTLSAPASPATGYTRVTAGLSYTPQLTTLGIDIGDPTIQGKMKKLPAVTVRVKDTLGLQIGTTFNDLVNMDDLIVGNIGKDTNAIVTGLVTGDALQTLDPQWSVPGQYCIQQPLPYPCTILGLIPQIAVGDVPSRRTADD